MQADRKQGSAGRKRKTRRRLGGPVYANNEEIPLSELEQLLAEDLRSYLRGLAHRDRYIFLRRIGFGCEAQTLQAIGDALPGGSVTRERVRQIQVRIERNWRDSTRVAPHTFWVNLKMNLSLLRNPIFPGLREQFSTEKGFYEFLEMSSGLENGRLVGMIRPKLNANDFDEFWVANRSPAAVVDLVRFLEDRLGVDTAVAENLIFGHIGSGLVKEGDTLAPVNLSKPVGVANTLLDFPDGTGWRTLHQAVNKKGITGANMSASRMDGGIPVAVDNGWAYQCSRGAYRHLSYLQLAPEVVGATLDAVVGALRQARAEGRHALNLSVDVYQQAPWVLSYFELRHVVRAHGERAGVFFKGKSGADTISLDSQFDLVGQEEVLLHMFANAKKPLDKKFIASRIRSQSMGHAALYIDELASKGKVVRVSEETYAHVDNAFKNLDLAKVVKVAADMVENEPRIIEGERLQRHINRTLDLAHNKVIYLSLLRVHAAQFGYRWHFAQNLVCRGPIRFESLRDLCRNLLWQEPDRRRWVDKIQEHCLIETGRLNVLLGSLRAEILESQRTKASASSRSAA